MLTASGPRWLRNARWGSTSETPVDVRLVDGRVAELAERGSATGGIDVGGSRLLAGVHDRHLHVMALAAQGRSLQCSPRMTPNEWATALRTAPTGADGWVRVVGAHESFTGELDARTIDGWRADVPVRVQHRTGMLWTLNSAALREVGAAAAQDDVVERDADGVATGRLWRADAWLRDRLPADVPGLAEVGRLLVRAGVTAITDATPGLNAAALAAFEDAVRGDQLLQRVELLGAPSTWEPPAALRGRLRRGPAKIVLDEALLPDLDELAADIRAAHEGSRPVAVHCVSAVTIYFLLAAFDLAGGTLPGDRIEHGSVLPGQAIAEIARRGLAVVTQPGFLRDRGDAYLRDLDQVDQCALYPVADLIRAGVEVAFSSDAPYGPVDPGAWLQGAVERRTRSGSVVGTEQRVTWGQALRCLGVEPRVGSPADLIVVDDSFHEYTLERGSLAPRMVLIGGRVVWD